MGVKTFAGQPGSQYDFAATRGTDNVLGYYWQAIIAHNLVVLQLGEDVAFV